jgi:predicted dithiol-disulfide oxidoreductase (DUF899 family)
MAGKRLEGESAEHQKMRAELLEAESALTQQRERVAELRRRLPPGPLVDDYVFTEGPADPADAAGATRQARLSELFDPGHDQLILIHFMYGGAQRTPCPMCTMWADGYDAVARHVRQRCSFVVVAEAPVEELRAHARTRGWKNLRLLSSQGTSFKRDFQMADPDGAQHPGVSVFTKEADGRVRHFYTGEAVLGPDQWRGVDLLSPVWHLFDLLPQGRGDWFPSLSYGS